MRDQHVVERAHPKDGMLEIYDLPHGANPYLLYRHSNVVTNQGRQRGIEMITELSTAGVKHVAVGDQGIVQGPPRLLLVPSPPSRTDLALGNEIKRKEADSIVLSGSIANEVLVTVEFLTLDGPFTFFNPSELIINEVGLFADTDNLMFARRTFPSIPFDVGDRLGIRIIWHLQML